jgi:DUF971 family protein
VQSPALPTEIRRLGARAVRVVWADGHESEFPNTYLREHCPCAGCRARPQRSLAVLNEPREEIYPVQIGVVGRYAVSVEWSDGHDTGIYAYRTLRDLCPCEACAVAAARAAS